MSISDNVRIANQFYSDKDHSIGVRCILTRLPTRSYFSLNKMVSDRNHYANIIPLDKDIIFALNKRTIYKLPFDTRLKLQPEIIAVLAREYFNSGEFSQGYACARLGAYLLSLYEEYGRDLNSALSFCADALINLRPISGLAFAVDTLSRNIIPILNLDIPFGNIEPSTIAKLLIEIGSYFRDYGDLNRALRFSNLAKDFLEDERPSISIKRLQTRIFQHQGIAYSGIGDFSKAEENYAIARNRLADSDYPQGSSNDKLWLARVTLAQTDNPDLDFVSELIKDIYEQNETKLVSPWTMAEALWTEAEMSLLSGKWKQSADHINLGIKYFSDAKIIPTAILAPKAVDKYYEKYPPNSSIYIYPRSRKALSIFTLLADKVYKNLKENKNLYFGSNKNQIMVSMYDKNVGVILETLKSMDKKMEFAVSKNKTTIYGDVNVSKGDFVGGNKITNVHRNTNIFTEILDKVDGKEDLSKTEKIKLKSEITELTSAVQKNQPNESFIKKRLQTIKKIAPDIFEVTLSTLLNPVSGLGTVVTKIAEKMKEGKSK